MAALDPTDGGRSPDHSTCQHCGMPITWDEACYVHDASGFSDCGVSITGGERVGSSIVIDPVVTADPKWNGAKAEPVEWKGR